MFSFIVHARMLDWPSLQGLLYESMELAIKTCKTSGAEQACIEIEDCSFSLCPDADTCLHDGLFGGFSTCHS